MIDIRTKQQLFTTSMSTSLGMKAVSETVARQGGRIASIHPSMYPFIHKQVYPCIRITLCVCWTALSTTHDITSPLCFISYSHTHLGSKHSKPVVCDYSPPCLGLEHFLILNLPHYIQHKWYRTIACSPHTETVRKSLSVRKSDQFSTNLK